MLDINTLYINMLDINKYAGLIQLDYLAFIYFMVFFISKYVGYKYVRYK